MGSTRTSAASGGYPPLVLGGGPSVVFQCPSRESSHPVVSTHSGEREAPMPEAVLPKLTRDEATAQLPSDPTALLTSEQQRELTDDLAKIARQRRDAETASAHLRLA